MARLSTAYYNDYSGGLNNTASAREIEAYEASLLQNWDITYKGQLVRRTGITQEGDTQGDAISGLAPFIQTDGDKDLLLTEDTSLAYLNGSTFDALDSGFTAGNDFSFATCPINNRVYLGNEDNTLHHWDRASTTLNSSLTDLGAAVPHGNILRWHKNHMFVGNNVTISGTAYPNRIYWSALGDPDTYDTTNDFIEVPGNGKVVTFIDLGDSLMIFKERGIQYLDGWGDSDWRITASASNVSNLDEQVGCIAPKGATRVGNEVWFIDEEANIRRVTRTDFDAFRRDIVSNKIRGTLSTVNHTYLHKAVAWSHNDKVYFSLPLGSETTNSTVLVFDLVAAKRTGEEAWTTYTGWSVDFFVSYPENDRYDLYMGSASTKKVYKHEGDDDDGTAIAARWDGKNDDYKKQERYKRFKFGYITGEADSAATTDFYASIDSSTFGKLGELETTTTGSELGPTGTATLGPTGSFTLGAADESELKFYYSDGGGQVRGKRVMHSIRHEAVDETPEINGFSSHFKYRSLR